MTKDNATDSLIDINKEPWIAEAKSSIKPKAKELKEEVKRRATCKNITPVPRPNGWSVPELMVWLTSNPIQSPIDVQFLVSEVDRVQIMMTAAQQEQQNEDVALQQGTDWRGNIPYLRLIHCLAKDSIKPAYLRQHASWSRQMLDARNSEARPPTAYELIADCWNSESFNPSTVCSDCHPDYSSSIRLSYSTIQNMQKATARKVEDKLTHLRASLTRIISKWERSGQGDGGHLDSDDEDSASRQREILNEDSTEFGVLSDRPQLALDSQSAFLGGKPSYLGVCRQARIAFHHVTKNE